MATRQSAQAAKHRIDRADHVAGQHGDLGGRRFGVHTGHAGRLADTAGLVVAFALDKAVAVDDGHDGDAVRIAQADETRRLGRALMAKRRFLGRQDANGAAVDGRQRRYDTLAVAAVQFHRAAGVRQRFHTRGPPPCSWRWGIGLVGAVKSNSAGTRQVVGRQQRRHIGGLFGAAATASLATSAATPALAANAAVPAPADGSPRP